MTMRFIEGSEAAPVLDWLDLTDAIAAGHRLPKGEISDVFQRRGDNTLLSRHAWIAGLGVAVKTCLIFPGNAAMGKANINGLVALYSDQSGELEATLDFA
ncbi:MAG: ornithine cyclodeaminase, partial [Paracoccaceae bacterium]